MIPRPTAIASARAAGVPETVISSRGGDALAGVVVEREASGVIRPGDVDQLAPHPPSAAEGVVGVLGNGGLAAPRRSGCRHWPRPQCPSHRRGRCGGCGCWGHKCSPGRRHRHHSGRKCGQRLSPIDESNGLTNEIESSSVSQIVVYMMIAKNNLWPPILHPPVKPLVDCATRGPIKLAVEFEVRKCDGVGEATEINRQQESRV